MIDWYFGKLGPVLGIALAGAAGIVFVAGAVSIVAGVLDRDESKQRGFDPTGTAGTGRDVNDGADDDRAE